MKRKFKILKAVPVLLMLVLAFSMSAFASDVTDEPVDTGVPADEVDWTNDESYSIRFNQDEAVFAYTGKEVKPEVHIVKTEEINGEIIEKVIEAKDNYVVTYSDNVEIGTATVIVEGINGYKGIKKATFEIVLGKPDLSRKTAYNQITLTWEKVKGAEGYVIEKSTKEDSDFIEIKTVTSARKLEYVDKDVKFGNTYFYRIKAYKTVNEEKIYSNYSRVISQRVEPAKAVMSAVSRVSSTSLKVTWKKVAGATGYRVYCSTTKEGEYKLVKTVSGGSTLSYTDSDLLCGQRYYYKVRAYRTVSETKYFGSASDALSSYTRPARVTLKTTEITYTGTKANIKWKKASGAAGYKVYRATSENGDYKEVARIRNNYTFSWTDSGLNKNKVYYYKVSGYRIRDGVTYEGLKSKPFKRAKAGWRYVNGYKLYYNSSGKLVKDVRSIIGKQSSYVIKINKKRNCITVYAKDSSTGKYIVPVKSFICSTGTKTPVGTFYTPKKYRWRTLMGPSYAQWCTRITGNFLFHSVFYRQYNNNNTLSVSAYNKLGITASHGCVRLTAGDAKWIYDNCKLRTKVIIYNSSTTGPFGKPTAYKLSYSHTWDPTDPNMKYKCKRYGCH